MNDRKIVPYQTRSGLKIGCAYVPKPKLTQAYWLERQVAKRFPVLRWLSYSALAVAALVLISGRA